MMINKFLVGDFLIANLSLVVISIESEMIVFYSYIFALIRHDLAI